MPLTNSNLLTENRLARWLIENSPVKLQIARVWPFFGVAGGQLTYTRANSALTPATAPAACEPVYDDSDTAAAQTFDLADYITRYSICFADEDKYKHPNQLDEVEYALALRKLLYAYFQRLDQATGSAANGGLRDIIGTGRSVNRGGAALTLDCMDHAFNLVTENDGRPTHIMTSSRGLRTYQSLCRASGYEPPSVPWKWYDPGAGRMVSGEAPAFNGVPIIVNDMMVSAGSAAAADQRIYFMVLGDDGRSGPTRGVVGFVPERLKGDMFIRRETMGLTEVAALTLDIPSVPYLGTLEQTVSVRTQKTVWVSFPAGLGIGSQGALSMIHNFTPVADCTVA